MFKSKESPRVICQVWTQSTELFGLRHFGFSLHLTEVERAEFVKDTATNMLRPSSDCPKFVATTVAVVQQLQSLRSKNKWGLLIEGKAPEGVKY